MSSFDHVTHGVGEGCGVVNRNYDATFLGDHVCTTGSVRGNTGYPQALCFGEYYARGFSGGDQD